MSAEDDRHRALLADGQAALNRGDFTRARAICDEIFSFAPGSLNGLWLYIMSGKIAAGDAILARIETAAAQPDLPDGAASQLWFMIGKARDDLGDHTAAFEAFVTANRLKAGRYDPLATRRFADALIAAWHAAPALRLEAEGPRMVFILGMPRSGTSLAAQMIGRHPQIANLGEQTALGAVLSGPDPLGFFDGLDRARLAAARAAYLDRIGAAGQSAPVLVDKMPENYWFAGLIPMLFPEAVIVHMHRPRLATCWSCFRNDFREGHSYSNDFTQLLAHHDTQSALADAARPRAGDRWHEIALEMLVAEPRNTLAPLLTQLGLGWSDACLNPEDGGAAATLSKWQLRQGIDPELPQGWRAYLPFIKKTWGVEA